MTTHSPAASSRALSVLFLTIFIDLMGVGMAIPVITPLLLDPQSALLPGSDEATKIIVNGWMLACYALAQFFGAPILGTLSDAYGRKRLLTLSLLGTLVGYLLFAAGLHWQSLALLFVSRSLDGFTGGNISIAVAAIADVSAPEQRARNFGYIGMAFGLGFILGPALGGILSDSSIVPWFSPMLPFLLAAGLCAFNIWLLQKRFVETLPQSRVVSVSLLTGFRHLRRAATHPTLRRMFLVSFLFTLGINASHQFFQVFLHEQLGFGQRGIGFTFAYIGLCVAIVQGGLTPPISKRFTPNAILGVTLLCLAITLPLQSFTHGVGMLLVLMPFIAVFQGLSYPNVTALISNLSHRDEQGEVLGINQSLQSLGMGIPPVAAAYVGAIDITLPFVLGGIVVLLAWFALPRGTRSIH